MEMVLATMQGALLTVRPWGRSGAGDGVVLARAVMALAEEARPLRVEVLPVEVDLGQEGMALGSTCAVATVMTLEA